MTLTNEPPDAVGSESGAQERHLAISAMAGQASQVVATVSLLIAITVLARHLSLAAFGTYGLLVSLTTYVAFVQGTVEVASVKTIAEARDRPEFERAFSTALALYCLAGIGIGVLLAGGGTVLVQALGIRGQLGHQAQVGVFALAAVTALGWPLKVYQDGLRGTGRFVDSATAESIGYVVLGGGIVILVVLGAPLWTIVGVGGATSLFVGAASGATVMFRRLPWRFRRASVDVGFARSFARISGYFLVLGVAEFAIYSIDRVILAAFRSTRSVGLYEGPVRAHNLVRQLSGALVVPVLPTAARYLRENDTVRQRDLLVRGTRYTLAIVVPVTLVLMILAKPILTVWLGPRYATASTQMAILLGYWLVTAGAGVAASMLMAAGRLRELAVYAVAVAFLNLVLSLALTPHFGLTGVVVGTTVPYLLLSPCVIALALSTFSVGVRRFAAEVWLPAYSCGALLAVGLAAVRSTWTLDRLSAVIAVGAAGLVAYWALYAVAWLTPPERRLLRVMLRAVTRR
jgi:membrane protein EpsK